MKTRTKQSGFSLTEVLMAVGILTVGLLMVAGTFPVGIHLTAVSTERTLGAIAADEAFAKVQLYGVEMNLSGLNLNASDTQNCMDFNEVFAGYTSPSSEINLSEFKYPSVENSETNQLYNWSAIFRFTNINDPTQAQITVFVNRELAKGLEYFEPDPVIAPSSHGFVIDDQGTIAKPVKLDIRTISTSPNKRELVVDSSSYLSGTGFSDYITDKSTIVDGGTGNIYRVIETDPPKDTLYIDTDWQTSATSGYIWVVPPPVTGGKSPCVGVYQRIINF